jgi:hypothetical protein
VAAAGKSGLLVQITEILVVLIIVVSLAGLLFNGVYRREAGKQPSHGPTARKP